MDCKTARFLFPFAQPSMEELDALEVEQLKEHLGHCPECADTMEKERRVDQRLGEAMRDVAIPEHLRTTLLARLEAERGHWYRRWAGHAVRLALAASILIALVWGLLHWRNARKVAVDADSLFHMAKSQVVHRSLSRTDVEDTFRRLGLSTQAPPFRYEYLTAHGIGELPGHPGQRVPFLEFARERSRARAHVFILDSKRFNTETLDTPSEAFHGYPWKWTTLSSPNRRYRYLVLYKGAPPEDWLVSRTGV